MRGAALGLALLLAGCTVGPNYHRPAIDVPASYRNAAPVPNAPPFGNEKWWSVYQDETLQALIRRAIERNYDVQIAANRILQAQAQLGITRADQFPTVNASAGYLSEKIAIFGFNVFQLQGIFSWNVDFWGQYRRATESARANLLAAEWNRRTVLSTLVENVAMAYFQLRELDLELEIARNTLDSRNQSFQLTETLERGGAAGLLDVQRQISQQEDLLSILIGDNPHEIPRGKALTEQPLPVNIPAGLPSELLARRPDIQQAEQALVAANAQIGVARAQLFPSLPLTGPAGFESGDLLRLFAPGSSQWDLSAPLTQPIFNAGRLRSNVKLKEDQQQQALLSYRQTIQGAFRQVSDALIAFQKYREFREHQELLTTAAEQAANLSDMRYRGGVASYLEVLTNQTNYFAAELTLARARLNERLSVVQVYNSLGGGWQQ